VKGEKKHKTGKKAGGVYHKIMMFDNKWHERQKYKQGKATKPNWNSRAEGLI